MGVDVLQEGRSGPQRLHQLIVSLSGVVPDVVLVEADHHLLFRPRDGLCVVGSGNGCPDEAVHLDAVCQELRCSVGGLSEVLVHGDVVHIVVALGKDPALPLGEGCHLSVGAAACDKLYGRIKLLHRPGGFRRDSGILVRSLVSRLPLTVHLVAETPRLYPIGLIASVLTSFIGPVGAALDVAVLQEGQGILHVPRSQVDCHHDVTSGLTGPAGKLIGSDEVGLDGPPCKVYSPRPLRPGADSVPPVISGDEVASGIPDHGDLQCPDELQDIGPEAVLVRTVGIGLPDAAVYGPSQVLDE